jgi:glycosyltransferase involved in cell wall biosynthesis
MKISIVIPTKNRAEVLKRSLGSAVSQTYAAHEIIVADNNSVDNTKEIINSFNDKRIVHLHTDKNLNITENWMRGIKAANGDWVKIIYDDDWIDSTFLEKTIAHAANNISMIHTGGIVHVTMMGHSQNSEPVFLDDDILHCTSAVDHNIPAHFLLAEGLLQVSPVGTLIKKTALDYAMSVMPKLDKICFNSGIGPDSILVYAATTQSKNSWIHIPEILAHYDGRHGSLTIRTLGENPGLLKYCYARALNLLDTLWLDKYSEGVDLNKYLPRSIPKSFLELKERQLNPTATQIYMSRPSI